MKMMQRVLADPSPNCPNDACCTTAAGLSQLTGEPWHNTIPWTTLFIRISSVFPLMSWPAGSHPEHLIAFLCYASYNSPNLPVSWSFLFFISHNLDLLKCSSQIFHKMSLNLGQTYDVFSWNRLRWWVWGMIPGTKLCPHHFKSGGHARDWSLWW